MINKYNPALTKRITLGPSAHTANPRASPQSTNLKPHYTQLKLGPSTITAKLKTTPNAAYPKPSPRHSIHSFFTRTSEIRNYLPPELKSCTSIDTFTTAVSTIDPNQLMSGINN